MVSKVFFSAVMALCLVGCGGGGGGGPEEPSSKLFVVDSGNRAIGSMIDPNPTPGTFTVDRIIAGFSTGLGTGSGHVTAFPSLALDAAGDRIYVSSERNVVLVWDNAGRADGDVRAREITGTVSRATGAFGVLFRYLFIDSANNRLYATDGFNGEVHVFDSASTLNGSVPVTRTIKPDYGAFCCASTFGVAVDATRNILYVGVVPSDRQIMVFDGASALNTGTGGASVAPDRTLLLPNAGAFHLDAANNRLYVAEPGGFIRVFDSASTLNGAVTADRSFQLGTTQKHIFVDAVNNRLYAVSDNQVIIVPNASTADGPSVPATLIQVQTTGSLFSAVASKP